MLKWVGRILYVMVISLLSLQVYSFAYYSKLQEYYTDNVAENINNDELFLNGVNTLMGIEYYRNSPILYEYIKDTGDYQLTVRAYAVGIMSNNEYYDGFIILVNDVRIVEDSVVVENPIIKISVELDANTLNVDNELTNRGSIFFDSEQPFAYYNVPVLFLFDAEDYLKVPDQDTFANLTRIEVNYSNRDLDEDDVLIYNESPLFLGTTAATSESAFNKDATLSINSNDYRLRAQFADDVPTDAEIASFNLVTDRGDLSPYNWTVWRTMIIYGIIVAGVTYLLFFHKKVREHYKTRNYGIKKDGTETVDAEPIFKDIDYKDENGK
jgi:hypothetical protein